MDAIDILGSLLGKKSGSGSPGGNILKDILGGGSAKQSPQRRQAPQPRQGSRPKSIGETARSLEDLLQVSHDRHNQRHPQATPQRQPEPERQPRYKPVQPEEESILNEQSIVLVRAMIGAAKSDGRITEDEQRAILGQLGHLSQDDLNFLRQEFARPADARELAWNTPLGMEDQIYSMSLIAIDLDENKEAEYLADLAHGLRLQPRHCNQLHQKYNAPEIFRV